MSGPKVDQPEKRADTRARGPGLDDLLFADADVFAAKIGAGRLEYDSKSQP